MTSFVRRVYNCKGGELELKGGVQRMQGRNLLKLAAIILVPVILAVVSFKPILNAINLGLDLQGGIHVVYEAVDTPASPVTEDSINRAMATLENRINETGVKEPVLQREGNDRIIVELAGVQDPEAAIAMLNKTAVLEFKNDQGQVVLTGKYLKTAQEGLDPGGQALINLEFTAEGAKKFAQITSANVGRNVGIYLDEKELTNPVIRNVIADGKAQISGGDMTIQEARDISVLLRSGALPVNLEIIEKRVVGPTLGADSLEKSKNAGLIGIAAILAFMILYYRVPGLIASFTLIIYSVIVLGLLAAIDATLTLPGIAGFLLSIGIAVDSNIIIFERIKEELRNGKSLRGAIEQGFKRAITTVFDSNATTLIAALVLMYFGTSSIRGFAITLGIGIAASMFTAITLTRIILRITGDLAKNKKLYGA